MYVLHDAETSKDSNAQESISMTIYPTVLYILQHSITGLKYFGKTTQDIRKYKGSGVYWTNHIKKHGKKHVVPLWVSDPYIDSDAIVAFALAFSKEHNIVESKDWANIIPENGLSGGGNKGISPSAETKKKQSIAKIGKPSPNKGKTASDETKKKQSIAKIGKPSPNKGKTASDETKKKQSIAKIGKPREPFSDAHCQQISIKKKGIPQSPEHIKNRADAKRGKSSGKQKNPAPEVECPHCGLVGRGGGMKRYHFDNCKSRQIR